MFENIMNFFKKFSKKEKNKESSSAAKERLHLVLMQDRANVSADFLELMRQEIIEVIKKYIDIDEKAIDVKLTNKMNEDGTVGAPALYANIPIVTIKNETRKMENANQEIKNEKEQKSVATENKKDNQEKSDETEKKEEIKKEVAQDTEQQELNKIENIEKNKLEEDNKLENISEKPKEKEDETKKEQEHIEKQNGKQKIETNS